MGSGSDSIINPLQSMKNHKKCCWDARNIICDDKKVFQGMWKCFGEVRTNYTLFSQKSAQNCPYLGSKSTVSRAMKCVIHRHRAKTGQKSSKDDKFVFPTIFLYRHIATSGFLHSRGMIKSYVEKCTIFTKKVIDHIFTAIYRKISENLLSDMRLLTDSHEKIVLGASIWMRDYFST